MICSSDLTLSTIFAFLRVIWTLTFSEDLSVYNSFHSVYSGRIPVKEKEIQYSIHFCFLPRILPSSLTVVLTNIISSKICILRYLLYSLDRDGDMRRPEKDCFVYGVIMMIDIKQFPCSLILHDILTHRYSQLSPAEF